MKSKAIHVHFGLLSAIAFFIFAGFTPLFSDENADKSGKNAPKIVCKKAEGKIAKIRCKFSTESASEDREVTFFWRSPTSPKDDRRRTLVLPGGHRSVFDERYLYGRAAGEWEISVSAGGATVRAIYLLDDEKNFYEKHPASQFSRIPAPVVQKEPLRPKHGQASETCSAEDIATEVVQGKAGETMLQIKTAKGSKEWPVGSGIYDTSATFVDRAGNRYVAIRYTKAQSGDNAAVLATSCGGRLVVSEVVEGYIEKIGSDELYGVDPGVNTALCNTRPCKICRSYKPALYRVAGIEGSEIRLNAYSVERSADTPFGKRKYTEYFKQLRLNMSVALYSENLYLDAYLNRLPEGERAFCHAVYEEKPFNLLIPLFSKMTASAHQ
jgi:hypothetical protein